MTRVLPGAVLFVGVMAAACGQSPQQQNPVQVSAPAQAGPNEPCVVTGSPEAREAGEKWCTDGIFTKVDVKTDGSNFVVILQFSKKGMTAWEGRRSVLLNQFRGITNELVEKAGLNAAFSLHDTAGQMVGGCARSLRQSAAVCK